MGFRLKCAVALMTWLWIIPVPLHAQDADSPSAEQAWQPPLPQPVDFDWIMLVSGEWLKGELISLYEDELEFDSDELDELSFDWDDVLIVMTHKPFEVLFLDRSIHVGQLVIRDGKVAINGAVSESLPRSAILSIARSGEDFTSLWDGDIGLSVDMRDGSTNRKDYAVRVITQRRTSQNRFQLNYQYAYGEVDGSSVEDSQRLTTSYDIFLSDRWFVRPAQFEYFADEFQNIDERYTLTSSLGYHLIDNSHTTWDVFLGAGYQKTYYVTVQAGRDDIEETPVGLVGTFLDIELTSNIDYDFLYEGQWVNTRSGGFNHHFDTGLSIEFLGDFDLDIRLILDRVEDPVPESDGTVPDKNDSRLQVGLSYEF